MKSHSLARLGEKEVRIPPKHLKINSLSFSVESKSAHWTSITPGSVFTEGILLHMGISEHIGNRSRLERTENGQEDTRCLLNKAGRGFCRSFYWGRSSPHRPG